MATLPKSPTFSMHVPAPCAEEERAIQTGRTGDQRRPSVALRQGFPLSGRVGWGMQPRACGTVRSPCWMH